MVWGVLHSDYYYQYGYIFVFWYICIHCVLDTQTHIESETTQLIFILLNIFTLFCVPRKGNFVS